MFAPVTASHVEPYLADIEEDGAEALVCDAFLVADENTAAGRHDQPTEGVVFGGVMCDVGASIVRLGAV
jgi:hypothetical protein